MPNISLSKDQKTHNSGRGALGPGGQPEEDPRDLDSGGEGRVNNDLGSHTGPVGGAFGNPKNHPLGEGSAGNETVGPMGDKGIV